MPKAESEPITKTAYNAYLQSAAWQEKRKEAYKYYSPGSCDDCGLPRWLAEIFYDQDLHVCRKSYADMGNENVEDLYLLCRRCHETETFGRSELRKMKVATCEVCGKEHYDYRSSKCLRCDERGYHLPLQAMWDNVLSYAVGDGGRPDDASVIAYFTLDRLCQMMSHVMKPGMDELLIAEIERLRESIPDLYLGAE